MSLWVQPPRLQSTSRGEESQGNRRGLDSWSSISEDRRSKNREKKNQIPQSVSFHESTWFVSQPLEPLESKFAHHERRLYCAIAEIVKGCTNSQALRGMRVSKPDNFKILLWGAETDPNVGWSRFGDSSILMLIFALTKLLTEWWCIGSNNLCIWVPFSDVLM